MSSFVKEYNNKKYYCIDDYFAPHRYWYIEMNDDEKNNPSPFSILEFSTLKWRGGDRVVLTEDEMFPD